MPYIQKHRNTTIKDGNAFQKVRQGQQNRQQQQQEKYTAIRRTFKSHKLSHILGLSR